MRGRSLRERVWWGMIMVNPSSSLLRPGVLLGFPWCISLVTLTEASGRLMLQMLMRGGQLPGQQVMQCGTQDIPAAETTLWLLHTHEHPLRICEARAEKSHQYELVLKSRTHCSSITLTIRAWQRYKQKSADSLEEVCVELLCNERNTSVLPQWICLKINKNHLRLKYKITFFAFRRLTLAHMFPGTFCLSSHNH